VAEQDKKTALGQQAAERMSVAAIFVITTGLLILILIDIFDKALWAIGLALGINIISAILWEKADKKIIGK